jgi:hypothetical protein
LIGAGAMNAAGTMNAAAGNPAAANPAAVNPAAAKAAAMSLLMKMDGVSTTPAGGNGERRDSYFRVYL